MNIPVPVNCLLPFTALIIRSPFYKPWGGGGRVALAVVPWRIVLRHGHFSLQASDSFPIVASLLPRKCSPEMRRQRRLMLIGSCMSMFFIVWVTSQWAKTNTCGCYRKITWFPKHSATSQKWCLTTWCSFWLCFLRHASFMVRKGNARRSRSPCVRTLATI